MRCLGLVVIAAALSGVLGGGQDLTLAPGATGASVVEATVARITASCLFPDDKLFLRRLAYVESKDGADPNTFRPTYYGGIWQVDEAMFDVTQSTAASITLAVELADVERAFNVKWADLDWADLTVPFHSGLAAALYLVHSGRTASVPAVPRDISGQADFWVQYYRPAKTASDFTDQIAVLEQGCTTMNSPDLVFVLDASGSVGQDNFDLIKAFVKDVIRGFTIGADDTRVAVIRYSSTVVTEFDLHSYNSATDVLDAVDSVGYTAGGTNTHLALYQMVDDAFTVARGARPRSEGRPRVGIVLTDGQSNDAPATIIAAAHAHASDITMIAIGVTVNVNMDELEAIASVPTCLHLFLLTDFSEVAALSSAIEQRSCDAPVILNPTENCTELRVTVEAGFSFNCRITVGPNGATVKLNSLGGDSTMFIADDTFPSSAYFSQVARAVPGEPDAIFIPPSATGGAREVYCQFEADLSVTVERGMCVQPGDRDWCASDPCQNGGTCIDNGDRGYTCQCEHDWTGEHCEDSIAFNCGDNNPCTQETIDNEHFYHPGPTPNQFVQCDQWGGCWEMSCPPGLVWDSIAYTCNWP